MIDQLNATAHDGTRVLLSPFLPGDVQRVFAICQDADIQHWTTVPSPYSMDNAEQYVNDYTPSAWREMRSNTFSMDVDGPELVWAVRLAGGPLAGLQGSVGLKRTGDRRTEIGWWLSPEARGRGVMRATVAEVLRVAFDELAAQEVGWCATPGNNASALIAQRTGFGLVSLNDTSTHYGDEPMWTAVIHAGDPIAPRDDWPKL